MGKKSDAPPAPDYTPIANASKESAQLSYDLAKEQFEWAKKTYAEDKTVIDRVVSSFLSSMEANEETARADRERYETIFQPLEDDLAEDAATYDTPERRAAEAGRAQAGVGQQFQAAREQAVRNLESFGVNPGATRYAALDIGLRTQEAAAKAAAGNNAARAVEDRARAIRSEAINVGRGYPGQIAGQYSTSIAAGSGAGAQQLAGTGSGANTMGTGMQWQGQGNNALGVWGNALTQGHNTQMAAHNANQNASSGWGAALGLVGGALMSPYKPWVFAAEGGAVPTGASPTGGDAVDDVDAKLTAGEFVVPKMAVNWYGEKHFYNLIEKAQKEKGEAQQRTGAIPDVAMAPPAKPNFVSRSGAI